MAFHIPISSMAHEHTTPDGKVRRSRDFTTIAEDLLPHRSASPLARGIIARDFVDYTIEHGDDDDDAYSVAESLLAGDLPAISRTRSIDTAEPALFLRPSGVVYGTINRPSLAPQLPDHPVPSERELALARQAEASLLRDNHILPPKHGEPDPHPGFFTALYRKLFSTKVRPVPATKSEATETSPLLGRYLGDEELAHDVRWSVAVAADKIQTTWQREAMTLFQYSRSLILTFLLHYSVQLVSIFTIGRFGKSELGAVSCKLLH